MEYANKIGYPYIIVIGIKEVETSKFNLKNMKTGEEIPLTIEEIIAKIARNK
jgi:histidyl-tRNA synthetase